MKRTAILIVIVAALVALFLVADLQSLSSAILSMPGEMFAALLGLLVLNELTKGLRWAFFLRRACLDIRVVDGVLSYLAAQAATAIPGGSMLSARLAQEHGHVRMHQAASALVGQAVADVWAISLLAAAAMFLTEQRPAQLLVPGIGVVASLIVFAGVRSPRLRRCGTTVFGRWRRTRRFLALEEDFLAHAAALMRPRTLSIGGLFSASSTILSALILLVITDALTHRGISPGEAVYVHSLSVATRMVLPVPGGYGVGDASLAGMLNFIGIGLARATFIALAYRSVGVLFRTVVGVLVLVARYPYLLVGPLDAQRPQPVGVGRWAPRPLVRRLSLALLVRTGGLRVEAPVAELPRPTLPGGD
ncbi:MAG: lysylphosphatidylglycerol synthase transmembrane domain-containing protein [Sphaerobacter sp.]|nr:lysylphosphatidylglycerol synthase transmembrane domain-containing protein [Sphaerobacter sp.]